MSEEKENESSNTRTTKNSEGASVTAQFTQDRRSLAKLIDGNGNVYQNTFDENSNLNETIYPDGLRQSYTYEENGNLQTSTSRSSRKTTYAFNRGGNIVRKAIEGQATTYEYFENGLLKKASNKDSTVDFTYSSDKKPLTITYDRKVSLHYKYNTKGQRVSLADSSGRYNVTYRYDHAGRLIETKQNGRLSLLKVEYKNDKIKSKKTGDNTNVSLKYSKKTNSLQEMNIQRNSDKIQKSQNFVYSYDALGRKKKIEETITTGIIRTWTLAYDRMSQLVSYSNGGNVEEEISYDANWNRKLVKSKQDGTTHYVTNSVNQLTKLNEDEKLSYDDDGNLVRVENLARKIDQRFEYDGRHGGKLSGFTGSKGQRCTYTYDALDNLKSEDCDGAVTEFLVDPFGTFGDTLIGEVSLLLSIKTLLNILGQATILLHNYNN